MESSIRHHSKISWDGRLSPDDIDNNSADAEWGSIAVGDPEGFPDKGLLTGFMPFLQTFNIT